MTEPQVENDALLTGAEQEALCICAEIASVNLSAEDEYIERMCDNHVAEVERILVARMARVIPPGAST